jgi:hypothetical protein
MLCACLQHVLTSICLMIALPFSAGADSASSGLSALFNKNKQAAFDPDTLTLWVADICAIRAVALNSVGKLVVQKCSLQVVWDRLRNQLSAS